MNTADAEQAKYERMWAVPDYAKHSPGEHMVDRFMDISGAKKGETVIDLGCGTGRATLALANRGLKVTGYDITKDGLETEIPFRQGCLWDEIHGWWNYGYCADVMEHIPAEYVMLTLSRMAAAVDNLFLHICNVHDSFGKTIGEPLHLTVMPFEWWKEHLQEVGEVVDARDLMMNSMFYVRC